MKLALLLTAFVVLALPTVAQAHSYYKNKPHMASRLEGRINGFRVKHNAGWLLPGFANASAVIALQKANYHEHKWSLRIGGEPYGVWSLPFFPPPQASAMLTSIRPHGASWTPYQVLRRWKHKDIYRAALLWDGFTRIGVRAGFVHQHKGAYKGKGRCTVYYVSLAGPGI